MYAAPPPLPHPVLLSNASQGRPSAAQKASEESAALAEDGKSALPHSSKGNSRDESRRLTTVPVTPRRRRSSTWSGTSSHHRRASIASLKNFFRRSNSIDEEKPGRSNSIDEENPGRRNSIQEEEEEVHEE